MDNHSFLTPKERARIVINSAIASSFNKLVDSHTKRFASISSECDHLMGDLCDTSAVETPTGHSSNDATSEVVDTTTWNNSSDFYVSMLNFSLGFGSVLTFPKLCYKHGGGIFIIPYLIMLFLEGIPLVCLEIIIGQRFKEKYLISTWRQVHPSTIGLGLSAVFVSLSVIAYFNVIVAWCVFYFVHSLQRSLPWSSCPTGSDECFNSSSPSEYYWYRTTLRASHDINSLKDVNWHLYLYLVISWVLVLLYNIKGVKAAVKPGYVILIVGVVIYVSLFLFVVHLDGWAHGLAILFDPSTSKINKLLTVEIWQDAALQVFFSLGIGFGSIIVFSSYNNVGLNCKYAALCYGLFDTIVGISSCIIVFSLRGFEAFHKEADCKKLLQSNVSTEMDLTQCNKSFLADPIPNPFSLVFITWSDSFTHIAYPPLWSSLSYFLLFLVGIGSVSGMVLLVTLFLQEITTLKQEVATGLVCLVCCIFGLVFVTDSGVYLVDLFHNYTACSLPWVALVEVLSVICAFGRNEFCAIVKEMTGQYPSVVWRCCWFFISPVILITLITLNLYQMTNTEGGYFYSTWKPFEGVITVFYPSWCYVIMALLCLIPLLLVFGVLLFYSIKSRHILIQTCHNSWKRFWYWCRKEEEFELQEFSEFQRHLERDMQFSGDRIDANFPELLAFDNIQESLRNGTRDSSLCFDDFGHHKQNEHGT